jgi:hypothetical protein
MKKLLYTLLAVTIIFSACEKEEDENSNSGNISNGDIQELEEILQGGKSICSWRVIEMTQQHREGYFTQDGEKVYTDAGNLAEIDTITIDDNVIFTFYDNGDSLAITSSQAFAGALEFSDSVIYQVTGANQVEFMGQEFFGYQIFTIWEISTKNDTFIETYYDDFWPIASSSAVDSFQCDQGNLMLEKVQ